MASLRRPDTEDTFADDLQVVARKIIVWKPSFYLEANQWLKAQYAHTLQDPYYTAMVHSTLQSSQGEETFTRFQGHLVTMFDGCTRQRKSSATSSGINAKVSEVRDLEAKLSNNSRQWQHRINQQEAQISSLHEQNKQLKGLLDPKVLVNAISQAVTTGLKISSHQMGKGDVASNGTGFVRKPYLRKPRPSQLAPGADGSLNPDLECQYCKDTVHLNDKCIKLNHQLALEQNVAPNTSVPRSKVAN